MASHKKIYDGLGGMSLAKGITATAKFSAFYASQIVYVFEFWASVGHMYLQGIGSDGMLVAYILYMAYHCLA